MLQLLFFALGLLDLGFDGGAGSSTTRGIVTGVLGLIAFLVGGLLAGASTLWTAGWTALSLGLAAAAAAAGGMFGSKIWPGRRDAGDGR